MQARAGRQPASIVILQWRMTAQVIRRNFAQIGWLELKTEQVNEIATQNTARVVRDVQADIIGTIEVDNRIALQRFNEQLLPSANVQPYPHVMLIDGNDDRGIDVGLLSRFLVGTMRSHVDEFEGQLAHLQP
jgi:hypothetical protein